MLNLNSIMLSSSDYQKLGDFYGALLQKKPEMEDKEHSVIGYLAGSCFITICSHDKVHGKSQNPERIILFFETKDVQEEFDRVKDLAGAVVVKEPYKPSEDGNATIATLADPDGNYFQLVTPWNA
jgi:predicted enzyme related to lactoylglutathione lyase